MAILWLANGGDPNHITLPETNSSHLKMDAWNTSFFPFGAFRPIFQGGDVMLASGRVLTGMIFQVALNSYDLMASPGSLKTPSCDSSRSHVEEFHAMP